VELLQRGEKLGFLSRVGEAKPEHIMHGIVSLEEKEIIERAAQLIQNDYFVRCEDAGVGMRRLILSSGKTLETKKEVVLVNCRSSICCDTESAYKQDLHPLRPDGSIRPGVLLGLTGPSAYGITLLHLKGSLDISFHGSKDPTLKTARSAVELHVKVVGNMMFKLGVQLGSGEMDKFTLNPDYWLPAPRRWYASGKMMRNADKIMAVCETTLEALQAYE